MRAKKIERKTNETDICLNLNLDGSGIRNIDTGVGFLDHMLELFASHGNFDLDIRCKGDLNVDAHHTVEDIGICLGKAINDALGEKIGVKRYASFTLPMDECLANVTIDVSGRPYLVFNGDFIGKVGNYDMELTEEFFRAVSNYGGLTIHVNLIYGSNNHHKVECVFKAFARALASACEIVSNKLPSTKGVIE